MRCRLFFQDCVAQSADSGHMNLDDNVARLRIRKGRRGCVDAWNEVLRFRVAAIALRCSYAASVLERQLRIGTTAAMGHRQARSDAGRGDRVAHDRSGRTLEVGCGTGTNAIYLAQHGFEVIGVDISPRAVENARAQSHGRCRFETVDFLNEAPPGGPFQFVFDRGCFHTFDEDHERARFAQKVVTELVDDGVWLSLIGSTEGPPRDAGPPRRSAREVMDAIEPSLEIVQFRSGEFDVYGEPLKAWLCLSRKRMILAQPSSGH